MSVLFMKQHTTDNNSSLKEKKTAVRSKNISYEDLLVSKYLDEIQQSEKKLTTTNVSSKKLEIESPYLQKLSHSNFLNGIYSFNNRSNGSSNLNSVRTLKTTSRMNSRANSALAHRPPSQLQTAHTVASMTKFEPYNRNETNSGIFLDSNQKFQLLQNLSFRRERPSSAPVKGKTSSRKKMHRQSNLIKALAFRNGSREGSFLITARNINEFLNIATDRLQMPRAARRIFLENGDEIKHESQFIQNSSVYVSCGEEFEDPLLMTKNIVDKRKSTYWTTNGVNFLSKEENIKETLKKNDRQTRTIRFTKRVVCYENGKEYDPCLVVIEVKNSGINTSSNRQDETEQIYFKEFLEECTTRMKIPAKIAYNWFGERIQTINDIPKIDKCLQSLVSNKVELAPCWISKGEGFDARGAFIFIENLIRFTKENRKEIISKKNKLKSNLDELNSNEPENRSKAVRVQILEINQNLKLLQSELKELNDSIAYLDTIGNNLKSLYDEQINQGNSALFKHIKEVNLDDRLFGGASKKSIKLKVCLNGTDNSFETLINYRDMRIFDNIMREITSFFNRSEKSTYSHKFTRMFTENGQEIKPNDFKLFNNQIVWVSDGENWIDPKKESLYVLSLKIKSLLVITNKNIQPADQSIDMPDNESNQNEEDNEEDNEEEEDEDSLIKADVTSESDNEENKLRNFFKQKTFFKSKSKQRKEKSQFKSQSMEVASSLEFSFKTYTESLKLERIDKFIKTDDWDVLTDNDLVHKCLNEIQVSNEYLSSAENPREINLKRVMQLVLQCRANKRVILIPQLAMNGKVKEKDNHSLWYSDFQQWKFTQTGHIYNQFFTKLCLTLDVSISFKLNIFIKQANQHADQDYPGEAEPTIRLTGYAVILGTRKNNPDQLNSVEHQHWHYNKFGNIYSKSLNNKQMVLTDLNMLKNDLSILSNNHIFEKYEMKFDDEENSTYSLDDLSLVLIDAFDEVFFVNQEIEDKLKNKLGKELPKSQRWAIKQESFLAKSNREWRLSKLANFKWNKLSYSWPVDENEDLIMNFSWPLSGFLISGAPILKTLEEPVDDSCRSRLRVIRNGCIDLSTACVLSRMEVKNLVKEYKENLIKDSKNYVHCTGLTYSKLEFNAFLDACTNALGLRSAARRLFDENGEEHTDLNKLDQDQLVYISQGEAWIHPKLVKEEQERKCLLNYLAEDLNKIAYFMRFKNCSNFVLEVCKSSFQEGTKLTLSPCCLSSSQIERIKQGESIQHVIELDEVVDESIEDTKNKKAHERSHENTDAEYAKKFRWPWENIANKSLETLFARKSQDFNEEEIDPNEYELRESSEQPILRDQKHRPKTKRSHRNIKLSSQKFAFSNGFIYCVDYPSYVLGVLDTENNFQVEVFLMKKSEENPNQRWIYARSSNQILLKVRPSLALSVKVPQLDCVETLDISSDSDFLANNPILNKTLLNEPAVILQPTVETDYGNAYQKWFIDETIGLIYSFLPPNGLEIDSKIDIKLNLDVTSANKSLICTSYVAYDNEISQQGYLCEINETDPLKQTNTNSNEPHKMSKVLICLSCASAMRGKYKISKLTRIKNFSCHFAKTKDKLFKQANGFKYLYGKIDLSSNEAENSFKKWLTKFIALKNVSNPRSVLAEMSAGVKQLYTIKLLVYKNGEGRLKPSELMIGSSVQGLLDQSTARLQLRSAARRFYTQDGTLILDVQDLIDWCLDFYKKEYRKLEKDDSKSNKPDFVKQQSFTFASNSLNSITQVKKSASTAEFKESEKTTTEPKSASLLDKVEFTEISQGSKNTTIPNYSIIKDDTFTNENSQPSLKPSKYELKRLINEIDRSVNFDLKKLLKWPVEVWVTSGEPFVSPQVVQKNENKSRQKREQIDKVQAELEKQTHVMRQMAGRRMNKQTTGVYKAVKNPECPVVKEGHWSEIPFEEQQKQAEVTQLKYYVDEIKNPNKISTDRSKGSTTQLYGAHPITKRILVYLNGQTADKAQFCWATNIEELNEAVKIKFRLNKPIKFFFTEDGKIISRFEDISRDQLVCVSTGREFISSDQRNKDIEIKANWSRTIKVEGINATNIKVNSKLNEDINVDPFAAPTTNKSFNKNKSVKHLALTGPSRFYNNKINSNKSFTDEGNDEDDDDDDDIRS